MINKSHHIYRIRFREYFQSGLLEESAIEVVLMIGNTMKEAVLNFRHYRKWNNQSEIEVERIESIGTAKEFILDGA